jgi:D-serine deaminase-like pyridoxal phosphate-dependent protein
MTSLDVRAGSSANSSPLLPILQAADGLPTPCLVVDVGAVTRNIELAAAYFRDGKVKLRPHFKAHKCTTLMHRQVAAGSCSGVTCATASEAIVLASAGFDDILLANEIVDRRGLALVSQAAQRSRVTICVDNIAQVTRLEEVAAADGVEFGVLIEIDVGSHRCGLPPASPELIAIAAALQQSQRLTLRGLQGYEGHAVLETDRARRGELVLVAAAILEKERARLTEAGIRCETVSGGGTGTYDIASDAGALDEIQAGSYVLMDARYAELGLPFENALYCCASVISRCGQRVVLNAGLKALSVEYGMPKPVSADVEVLQLSDEHAQLRLTGGQTLNIGEYALLIPGHVDPSVNLHPTLFAFAEDGTVEEWRVDGRR